MNLFYPFTLSNGTLLPNRVAKALGLGRKSALESGKALPVPHNCK